jgi:hypothetical protein
MSVQQVPGQQYGVGVQQEQLQQMMPAPQAQPMTAAPPAAPPSAAAPESAAPAPADPMAAAAALRGRVGLLGPETERPNEPVTHGLVQGPGAGPEVLGAVMGSPLGDTLRKLSSTVGDPYFAQLAQKAKL